ncbi:hypothetical protein [Streptomyces scabiei]|uniref:hypothetical protein n=1 Tax=Streptomyces scabiei TaxID=1930 RepID=UPI0029B96E8E|nr:hypothetical protein [Streptomyces scabiei]MDX2689299.1 hypothetical protein [Streptomyces scabiei]
MASASRKYPTVIAGPPGRHAWSIPRNPGTPFTSSSIRSAVSAYPLWSRVRVEVKTTA